MIFQDHPHYHPKLFSHRGIGCWLHEKNFLRNGILQGVFRPCGDQARSAYDSYDNASLLGMSINPKHTCIGDCESSVTNPSLSAEIA